MYCSSVHRIALYKTLPICVAHRSLYFRNRLWQWLAATYKQFNSLSSHRRTTPRKDKNHKYNTRTTIRLKIRNKYNHLKRTAVLWPISKINSQFRAKIITVMVLSEVLRSKKYWTIVKKHRCSSQRQALKRCLEGNRNV